MKSKRFETWVYMWTWPEWLLDEGHGGNFSRLLESNVWNVELQNQLNAIFHLQRDRRWVKQLIHGDLLGKQNSILRTRSCNYHDFFIHKIETWETRRHKCAEFEIVSLHNPGSLRGLSPRKLWGNWFFSLQMLQK